jgi:hypothetical protein
MPDAKDLASDSKGCYDAFRDFAVYAYRNSGIEGTGRYWDPALNATTVRRGKWKLYAYHPVADKQQKAIYKLIDLEADPGETRNLVAAWPRYGIQNQLKDDLISWLLKAELGRGGAALPLDRGLSENYARFGVHTCNWVIDPYVDSLRKIDKMDYIDTGTGSDLARLKRLFPDTRRAVLYTSGEAESKSLDEIHADLARIARDYAPCDIVLADVETTMPDTRINEFLALAKELEYLAGA